MKNKQQKDKTEKEKIYEKKTENLNIITSGDENSTEKEVINLKENSDESKPGIKIGGKKSINFKDGVYFIPLSGAEQIGRNFNILLTKKEDENKNDDKERCIVMDAGISFESKVNGIEATMGSPEFLLNKKLDGILCTHAHEDHISAIPYYLDYFNQNNLPRLKIYATGFTAAILKYKIYEYFKDYYGFTEENTNELFDLIEVKEKTKYIISDWTVEWFNVTHSTLECNMLILNNNTYPNVNILHTGDWKFDAVPILGEPTDKKYLQERVKDKKYILIGDCTNTLEAKSSVSEGVVKKNLETILTKTKKKTIISCFSSNIARLKGILEIAKTVGKQVLLLGRSLIRMFEVAVDKGYIINDQFIFKKQDPKINPDNVIIICTGSQAEPGSALTKLAIDRSFAGIHLEDDWQIIFSSREIPGNEKGISDLKNLFVKLGTSIIDSKSGSSLLRQNSTNENDDLSIHASGHPGKPDIISLLSIVKPVAVIPVHGFAMHILSMIDICNEQGYNTVTRTYNGAIIELNQEKTKIIGRVNSDAWGTDGRRIITLTSNKFHEDYRLMESRIQLGQHGIIAMFYSGKKLYYQMIGVTKFSKDKDMAGIKVLFGNVNRELNDGMKTEDAVNIIKKYFYVNFKKNPYVTIINSYSFNAAHKNN